MGIALEDVIAPGRAGSLSVQDTTSDTTSEHVNSKACNQGQPAGTCTQESAHQGQAGPNELSTSISQKKLWQKDWAEKKDLLLLQSQIAALQNSLSNKATDTPIADSPAADSPAEKKQNDSGPIDDQLFNLRMQISALKTKMMEKADRSELDNMISKVS
jgi:hypothetical protein